jgi:PhnB protein
VTLKIFNRQINQNKIMANPIPAGFHTLTPHIVVTDGAAALEFYKKAFGAEERFRLTTPGGTSVMHAQMKVGDSVLMIGGEFPPNVLSPKSRGGTSTYLHCYLADADAAFARAVNAGCKIIMPISDTFWGDRYGVVEDPFGHQWSLATRQQDLTHDQLAANARKFFDQAGKGDQAAK